MTDISVLNSKFESSATLNLEVDLSPEVISVPVVHQVVKATLASRRQGNACTKNKAAVSGGGKKPFKQKGTGNARQGSTRSPIHVGGGVTFGPTPRDFTQKVPKKIGQRAIQSILADKLQAGKLLVVDGIQSSGKTKDLYKDLSGRGLKSVLLVTENKDSLALRAVKNIATAKGMAVEGFSVYEAVKFENLIIEKSALEVLVNRLR